MKPLQSFTFTRPLLAILNLIAAGTVERNFVRQSLRRAADRGPIPRPQIWNAQISGPVRKIVQGVLRAATRGTEDT